MTSNSPSVGSARTLTRQARPISKAVKRMRQSSADREQQAFFIAATQGRLTRRLDRILELTVALLLYGWVYPETVGTTQIFSFGFYTLHSVDFPIGLLIIYCIFSIKYVTKIAPKFLLLFMVSSAILVFNSVSGLTKSSAAALLEMRYWYALAFVPLAAILTPQPRTLLFHCRRYAIHASFALALLVYLRLATRPDLFIIVGTAADSVNDGGRGLSSQGATSLLIGFWLTFLQPSPPDIRSKAKTYALRAFLIAGLFLSRQGTSSIAAALTILIYAAVAYRPLRPVGLLALPITAIASPLILPIILERIFGADFLSHRSDNLQTRELVWGSFSRLFDAQGPIIKALGWPFGQMPIFTIHIRNMNAPWISSLHSMYFGGLKAMGYIGMTAFILAMAAMLIKHVYRFANDNNNICLVMAIILLSLFVSFYSYEANTPIALILMWPILSIRMPRGNKLVARPTHKS